MKEIEKEIVFSNDINRILNGINAFDYKYEVIPNKCVIDDLRDDFKKDVSKIFNNSVEIIGEDGMLSVNNLIGGGYPHRIFR